MCLPTISPQTCVKPSSNLLRCSRTSVGHRCGQAPAASPRPSASGDPSDQLAQDAGFTFSENSGTNRISPAPPLDDSLLTCSVRSHLLDLIGIAPGKPAPSPAPPSTRPSPQGWSVGRNRICSLSSDLHHPVQDVLVHNMLFSPHSS